MADGQMIRVIVYDRLDQYVCDIDPSQIVELTSTEEINGEHSLKIKTTQELEKTNRLVVRDGMGIWHEYVVTGLVGEHGGRKVGAVVHEYYCVWSIQYDLSATYIDTQVGLVPGHPSVPSAPRLGLEAALSGTTRWTIGTITVTTQGSSSFYRRSGWEGIQTLTERWGGEIDVTIEVGQTGVTARRVNFLEHVGNTTATRRFDYGSDLSDIKRKVSDEILPCRIVPLGKSTETEAGGYSRRPTIASANGGVVWLQDGSVANAYRIPDGNGGWEYPTAIVKNDVYADPAQLKAWAIEHIGEYTRPQVTYEASVVQLVKAGMNPHGVALGDNVIVVDRAFGGDGISIDARVIKIVQSLIDSTDVKLTIGNARDSLSSQLGGMSRSIARVNEQQTSAATYQSTAAYLSNLIDRLNGEINATGGYWYMVPGLGTRTYDREVSDPAVGAEASKVVEVKGGSIRIADSRTASGDWNWKTVFTSGHIAADLVTAANITTGYIGSAESGNYWDLDGGVFQISASAALGDRTVQDVLDDVDDTITGVDVEYASNTSATQAPTTGWSTTAPQWQAGHYIWSRTATTTPDGTSYSTPVMISGRDGTNGTNGVGVSSITVTYGVSTSAATLPSSWSSTAPTTIPQGRWLWTKTIYDYTDGSTSSPSYSKSYMGTDGSDGTSVTIKGSYDTYQQLIAAHPTGSSGDAYMVGTDLYVWNGSAWEDVGQIQGPAGTDGTNGTDGSQIWTASANPTTPNYTFARSALTGPTGVEPRVGDIVVRSYYRYTITSVAATSVRTGSRTSIRGAAGADGTSVSVQSSTKTDGVTTVVFSDGTTLRIADGEDGTNGVPGANGYVHTAWANSADGVTDFSTSVSANKKYLGVYTDNTAADSTNPSSYSWSLIKGADGQNGQNGLDGETAYVHTAWANSADGTTDFSTSVSAGKSYLGIYSDFIEADSTNPASYKWSKIEGEQGDDGTGVTQIVEQYYLSTSSSTTSGGSWQTSPPAWSTGKYYWTRSQVTWTDGTTTYTTPVLSRGLNSANSTAKTAKDTADSASTAASNAAKVATDYLTFTAANGLEMGYSGTNAKTRINTSGLEVFDGAGNSALFAGLSGSKSLVRIGRESNSGNVVMSSDGYVDIRNATNTMAHFGWGKVYAYTTAAVDGCYYDLGIRLSGTQIGMYSLVQGDGNTASGVNSFASGRNNQATRESAHAEGSNTKATGVNSHAEGASTTASNNEAHAEGQSTTASGWGSHAEGLNTTASADASHAGGWQTIAASYAQTVIGYYNISSNYQNNDDRYQSFIIGNGGSGNRSNSLYVTRAGNLWIAGTLTQNSDRRLKEHHAYLSDDACDFIRKLRPALYTKDGERHTGFYAQDVQDAEPDGWDTATVTAQHTDEGLDFDPLTLDYQALIAPLVAYCQHLEKRIEALEKEVK